MLKQAIKTARDQRKPDPLSRAAKRVGDSLAHSFATMGATLRIAKNFEIYGEGEPAEYAYKIVSGVVRTCKLLSDGRRQIGSFFLPGDIFGLEATVDRRFTAEAVTEVTLLFVKRSALTAIAARDSDVASQLWSTATADLLSTQEHMLLLGRRSAQERIAAFLLEMTIRTGADTVLELPMSRLDIADYLGLTIETVSRTFTALENSGVIALPSTRRVQLSDRAALARLNA